MSKKKIYLFGATGSTGIYLTEYFVDHMNPEKYELIAVGRRKTSYFDRYGITYLSVDITNEEEVRTLSTENVHALIILSGILPARMKGYKPQQYVDINIKGVLNITEHFKSSGVDRILYAISISDLHGYLPENKEFLPDMPPKYKYGTDHTIYAITKTAACEIIKTYYHDFGIKYYFMRLPNIYLYSPEKEYYVDGKLRKISYRYLIDRAIAGEDIELWGDPERKREIVYVKDFCKMVYLATFADCEPSYFNVGADLMVSMRDQIQGMIDVFSPADHKSKIIERPDMPSCDDSHMNIEKARKLLGYEPEYDYIAYLEDYQKEMDGDRFEGL